MAELFHPGDKVRYVDGDRQGNTGTVVRTVRRPMSVGGSRFRVRVVWDTCGVEGQESTVDDRMLRKEP